MSRLKRDLVEDRMSAPVYDHHRFDASQPPWRTISILRLVLVGLSMHSVLDLESERRVVMDWLIAQEPVHSYIADSETVRDSCPP